MRASRAALITHHCAYTLDPPTGSSWCQIMQFRSFQKPFAWGKIKCEARPAERTTSRMNGRSSSEDCSKQDEKEGSCDPGVADDAPATIEEESSPPLRHEPTGTSLRKCWCTALRNRSANLPTQSFSAAPDSAESGNSQYFSTRIEITGWDKSK